MITEIAGLKISYKNALVLNQKVAEAKEETENDLAQAKKSYQTLKRRAALLKKFLGVAS